MFNNRSYFVTAENGTVARWKVSAKIQQLLNTLKKPKKRHLEEFYEDDDIELEMAANPKDPNAPSPEGKVIVHRTLSYFVVKISCSYFKCAQNGKAIDFQWPCPCGGLILD